VLDTRGPSGAPGARDYIVLVDAHNASALGVDAYAALCFFQQDGAVTRALEGITIRAAGAVALAGSRLRSG
jgi:hypothetical protein